MPSDALLHRDTDDAPGLVSKEDGEHRLLNCEC